MKKNLMSVLILAMVMVNLVLTALLTLTVFPQAQKANELVTKVASAIELDLESGQITNAKGTTVSTEVGTVHVTLDSSSTWTLTGDTYITSFEGDAANVITNGYTLYVNGTAL